MINVNSLTDGVDLRRADLCTRYEREREKSKYFNFSLNRFPSGAPEKETGNKLYTPQRNQCAVRIGVCLAGGLGSTAEA
jgi:hypothetical protein